MPWTSPGYECRANWENVMKSATVYDHGYTTERDITLFKPFGTRSYLGLGCTRVKALEDAVSQAAKFEGVDITLQDENAPKGRIRPIEELEYDVFYYIEVVVRG
jgi:hypothetical protein